MANRKAAAARLPAVHPRVCGERRSHMAANLYATGSSPRVRRTHAYAPDDDSALRFIPACAGNAVPWNARYPQWSVHPRVCGERPPPEDDEESGAGSSPRVRGTPGRRDLKMQLLRFIPACAENAIPLRPNDSNTAVHPRVCGERLGAISFHDSANGSSPRVRGTLRRAPRWRGMGRFIPACAGNAARLLYAASRPAVHPRVCGERSRLV